MPMKVALLVPFFPHRYFGSLNLSVISLKGIPGALSNHTEDDSKGIKAHFRMDESGILHLDSVRSSIISPRSCMHDPNLLVPEDFKSPDHSPRQFL